MNSRKNLLALWDQREVEWDKGEEEAVCSLPPASPCPSNSGTQDPGWGQAGRPICPSLGHRRGSAHRSLLLDVMSQEGTRWSQDTRTPLPHLWDLGVKLFSCWESNVQGDPLGGNVRRIRDKESLRRWEEGNLCRERGRGGGGYPGQLGGRGGKFIF